MSSPITDLIEFKGKITKLRSRSFSRGRYVVSEECVYEIPLLWDIKKVLPMDTRINGYFDQGYVCIDTHEPVITIKIAPGYVYDGITFAPNLEGSLPAALVHDWIYDNAPYMADMWRIPRKKVLYIADVLFNVLLQHGGVRPWVRRLYYYGTRVFGYPYNLLERAAAAWCDYWGS